MLLTCAACCTSVGGAGTVTLKVIVEVEVLGTGSTVETGTQVARHVAVQLYVLHYTRQGREVKC